MAKDPAILFYPSDFLSGTMFMNDEQVGRYIRAMCAQHQHGHLTLVQLNAIVKKDQLVLEKFEKDAAGLLFNKRLDDEVQRRLRYIDSQRSRVMKRWVKPASSAVTETITATATATATERYYRNDTTVLPRYKGKKKQERALAQGVTKKKRFEKPSVEEIHLYCIGRKNGIDAQRFFDYYESKGWKIGTSPMVSWQAAVRTWEARNGVSATGQERPAQAAGNGFSRGSTENRRKYAGRAGYDAEGKAVGAVARAGEFDEGIVTLEGIGSK